MAVGRYLAIAGLLGLLVSGCTPPGIGGTGSAQVVLPVARRVQYVSTDVRLLKVTLTQQASGKTYAQTFPATALSAGGSQFRFVADNLPPGSYVAKLEAFLDEAGTLLAGSSTAQPFTVTAYATTPVTLPDLVLAATPIGDWQLNVGVTLSAGYQVTGYSAQLQTPSGATVAGPSGTTLAAASSFTWGDAPAYPSGESTTSLTVTATNHRGQSLTKTQIATIGIAAASTVSSTVTFTFP